MLSTNANAVSYTYGSTLPTTIQETSTAGELSVAFYNAAISLPGPDLIQNMGKGQVVNLLKAEVYNAEKSLKDKMGTDLFGNNSTGTGLVGIQVAIDDGSLFSNTSYAGISRSSFSTWKSFTNNASSGALSLQTMESVYVNSSIDESFATIIIAPYAGVVKIWGLLQPQQRFNAEDLWIVGARNIAFGNAPVVADPHEVSTTMHFVNENYFHLYTNENRNFAFIPFQVPFNQDAYIAHIRWYGQLVCESPRVQGVIGNVNFAL